MHDLFNPKSIAIIGASRHKEKLGFQILDNLLDSGYEGNVYPVNPEASQILNKKVFKSVLEIKDEIDLALVVVPAKFVFEVLSQCVEKEVKYAIIISAGFAESNKEGIALQEKIKNEICNKSKMRIIGPNCLGIMNSWKKLNLTFAKSKLIAGNVSAIFQSGALGVAVLDLAKKYDFGFAKFLSLGNKMDIEESDLLEYLAYDNQTKIIALYLENIANPGNFFLQARRASSKKPVVILKGGVTKQGAMAAFSHTAALISEESINDAIFSQSNLIVVNTMEEMLSVISILSSEPEVKEKKLGIITNAGGIGILSTDSSSREGFILPKGDGKYKNNPTDLTGTALADDYDKAIKYMLESDKYASILVLLTPQTTTEIEKTASVISGYKNTSKPIIASFLGDKTVARGVEILRKNNIPHFEDPEQGIKALSEIINYYKNKNINKDNNKNINQPNNLSSINDYQKLIKEYIPVPEYEIVNSLKEALKAFDGLNKPLVAKNISPNIIHKSQSGKIKLNICHKEEFNKIITDIGFPMLLQEMIDLPFEIIVGSKRDENLGILLTFGQGGIFTEKYDDVCTKISPLTNRDLDEMIKETRVGSVLIKDDVDMDLIKKMILSVEKIMTEHSQILEIDLNPIKVGKNQISCVDIRIKKK